MAIYFTAITASSCAVDWSVLRNEVEQNTTLQKLKKELEIKGGEIAGYYVHQKQLLYKGRMVIPKDSTMIDKLLNQYHMSAVGGHNGEYKTYLRLADDWYWEGMRKTVTEFVRHCVICQRQKASHQQPAGLLQPLPIPSQVWEDITMDFVEALPKSGGFDTVLVVVDRLSKYAHFIGLRHPFTASTVAHIFVKEVVRLHGFPASIISDRDKIFMSKFWTELFKLQGSTLLRSTTYHPQTDGQSEIVNQALETYLRCFVNGQPRQWSKWLHWAEYCYNTAPHMSIKMSPFMALYGRPPPSLIRFGNNIPPVDSLEQELKIRDAIPDDLKLQLIKAQHSMKKWADRKRRASSFVIGDLVFLKLQPYRQTSLAKRPCDKLAARYYGPYKIVEKIGEVAYKLRLPVECKIHPVFHVSQLKAAHGASLNPTPIPP